MSYSKYIFCSVFLMIVGMITLNGCRNDEASGDGSGVNHEREAHNETVQLTVEELKEFGIKLATAGPGLLKTHVSLPGEIIIPPDNLAHIHPRFPGMVKKVHKHIGDRVEQGETLAVIESNESLTEYDVKSLINGVIVQKHLSLGEIVTDSDHGFIVADLSRVWAMLKLYQKDLPYVKTGQSVKISADPGLPAIDGTIAYLSPMIDEATRTSVARVVLDNSSGLWKPGLFITGQITTSEINVAVIIPKTALEYYEGRQVVFVQAEDGFSPRDITIGRSNRTTVEIENGLSPGETYVSAGAFMLKAELQKNEFGSGHSH